LNPTIRVQIPAKPKIECEWVVRRTRRHRTRRPDQSPCNFYYLNYYIYEIYNNFYYIFHIYINNVF
jgi:hypothetical protein